MAQGSHYHDWVKVGPPMNLMDGRIAITEVCDCGVFRDETYTKLVK